MLGIAAFIIVCLSVSTTSGHAVNYCGAKMCGYTNAHTLCQFLEPSKSCAPIETGLSSAEKAFILDRLNRRRNDVASGKLPGLPSAGNMLKLRWVNELAKEAQLWADQCRPARQPEEHDACRDLYAMNVGQCVASVVGESPGLKIESLVDIWFMQNRYYKGNVTFYEPPNSSKHSYADFAQMIWARTFMVGCGRSRFLLPMNGRFRTIERLVCNFAPRGPTPYRPLWNPSVPANDCPSRSRPSLAFTSLCNYQNGLNQPIDIDDSMTIEDHIVLNVVLEIETNDTLFQGTLDEIYLTYLAMITMPSTEIVTISNLKAMQKRDLFEKNDMVDGSIGKVTLYKFDPETFENISKKISNKGLSTVGRPKAYKIEDLSHSDGDHHKDENHDLTEAVSKRKRDFYYDYNMDTFEENATAVSTEGVFLKNDFHENESDDHTNKLMPSAYTSIPILTIAITHENMTGTGTMGKGAMEMDNYVQSMETSTMERYAMKFNISDDYIPDPDTARELQAALDRMEQEAYKTSSTKKIRRQIEEDLDESSEVVTPVPYYDKFTIITGDDIPTTETLDLYRNSSDIESPPVLNMVLKYMPFLKTSEDSEKLNSAKCFYPSITLILSCVLVDKLV